MNHNMKNLAYVSNSPKWSLKILSSEKKKNIKIYSFEKSLYIFFQYSESKFYILAKNTMWKVLLFVVFSYSFRF